MKVCRTETASGLLLSEHTIYEVDAERAELRLKNRAEEEGWTQAEYEAAVIDVAEGYSEARPNIRGTMNEVPTCMVVAAPEGMGKRAPDYEFGDLVLCDISGVPLCRGWERLPGDTDESQMKPVTLVSPDGNREVDLPAGTFIYLVDAFAPQGIVATASELAGEAK